MAQVVAVEVDPLDAQVALLDATWQDYPQWETSNRWVAYKAASLLRPDQPPYPGFAVATRPDTGPTGPQTVVVEVWIGSPPAGLRMVHASVLVVGRAGIVVGTDATPTRLELAPGSYPVQIWVDAARPEDVARVVFALSRDETQ
jgi:hypothetical protein